MSFIRTVYYSAIIGGWMAFVGWFISEFVILSSSNGSFSSLGVGLMSAIVGGAIAAGLNMVAGAASSQWKRILIRGIPGFIGGLIGGMLGGIAGNIVYVIGLPRFMGFMILGIGVGSIEGIYEKSSKKLRNGAIGGLLGGLIGGILFDVSALVVSSSSGVSSRAIAFVILGICLGLLIGFTQVVLKDAWLTVVDGYGMGRQLIMSRDVTPLGRGDHLPLPFLGPSNQHLAQEHAFIKKRSDGRYVISDGGSVLGTFINHQRLQTEHELLDGDLIKIGSNLIRFNEKSKQGSVSSPGVVRKPIAAAPPPPPITPPRNASDHSQAGMPVASKPSSLMEKAIQVPPLQPPVTKPNNASLSSSTLGSKTKSEEKRIPTPPPPPPAKKK